MATSRRTLESIVSNVKPNTPLEERLRQMTEKRLGRTVGVSEFRGRLASTMQALQPRRKDPKPFSRERIGSFAGVRQTKLDAIPESSLTEEQLIKRSAREALSKRRGGIADLADLSEDRVRELAQFKGSEEGFDQFLGELGQEISRPKLEDLTNIFNPIRRVGRLTLNRLLGIGESPELRQPETSQDPFSPERVTGEIDPEMRSLLNQVDVAKTSGINPDVIDQNFKLGLRNIAIKKLQENNKLVDENTIQLVMQQLIGETDGTGLQ